MTTKPTEAHDATPAAEPLALRLSEGLGPNETLVERLRQERRATAWARGLDVDYPTAWEPNLLCHEAAAEIVRLRCLVEAVRGAFNRECDDADAILRALGLDPENCRTDGGSLKLQMVLGALEHRDVMLKREAKLAERNRCALICDTTPPYPFRPSIEAAYAIREDQP